MRAMDYFIYLSLMPMQLMPMKGQERRNAGNEKLFKLKNLSKSDRGSMLYL